MSADESRADREARHEADCIAMRVLPNQDALRALLRRLAQREPGLPVLAGERFGVKAVFRVVRSVGVHMMLEYGRELEARKLAKETEAFLGLMDRMEAAASERSSGWAVDPHAIGGRDGERFGESRAPRVGSAVVLLHTHDTFESFLHCGDGFQKFIYRVVHLRADNSTEVVEENFLTYDAAVAAYPEAGIRADTSDPT